MNSSKPLNTRSGAGVVSRHNRSTGSASSDEWAEPGGRPERCSVNAIAGAAATMTNGKVAASVMMPMASRRAIETSGEESSITGSRVQADIDQSDARRTPMSGATTAGTSSTAQNASAASRRSGVVGQAMSWSAARFGRAARRR